MEHHQECPIRLGKLSRMRNYSISKTATPGPGADSVLVYRHVTCAASRAQSQRPALLQAAAETTASGSTGKEDLKADRRVRHYKEVGLQEWPLAGRATARLFSTVSVSACLFVQTILFKKFTVARSSRVELTHSHSSHGRQNRRLSFCRCHTVREEVRIGDNRRGL